MAKNALPIAKVLKLPLSLITGTSAILGIKGSGKSHTGTDHRSEARPRQAVGIQMPEVMSGLFKGM